MNTGTFSVHCSCFMILMTSDESTFNPLTPFFSEFLVSYVGERQWWPVQSPNARGKKKMKG